MLTINVKGSNAKPSKPKMIAPNIPKYANGVKIIIFVEDPVFSSYRLNVLYILIAFTVMNIVYAWINSKIALYLHPLYLKLLIKLPLHQLSKPL